MTKPRKWWASARRSGGKRSTFEDTLATNMKLSGLPFEYEPADCHLGYMLAYIPDFRLPNGIIVEAKGFFDATDRTKMIRVRQANPSADIRFVFMKDNKLYSGSESRYSDWCKRYGFKYHIGTQVPPEWRQEEPKI